MRTIGPTAFFGAVSGLTGVAMGAFGAHAVETDGARELIETGMQYQMMHTMAALASLSFRNWGGEIARFAPPFFFAGILLFSGSLYLMGLGAPRWLGAVTPIGGVSFLVGWGVLAYAGLKLYRLSFARQPTQPGASSE